MAFRGILTKIEMISIPSWSVLEQQDSTGPEQIIQAGEIQIMPAGRCLCHSEMKDCTQEAVLSEANDQVSLKKFRSAQRLLLLSLPHHLRQRQLEHSD